MYEPSFCAYESVLFCKSSKRVFWNPDPVGPHPVFVDGLVGRFFDFENGAELALSFAKASATGVAVDEGFARCM